MPKEIDIDAVFRITVQFVARLPDDIDPADEDAVQDFVDEYLESQNPMSDGEVVYSEVDDTDWEIV